MNGLDQILRKFIGKYVEVHTKDYIIPGTVIAVNGLGLLIRKNDETYFTPWYQIEYVEIRDNQKKLW